MSIPTLLLFKEGKEAERLVGFISQRNLSEKIKSHL
jgi:thiol:disulfide interchange protein